MPADNASPPVRAAPPHVGKGVQLTLRTLLLCYITGGRSPPVTDTCIMQKRCLFLRLTNPVLY